MILVVLALTFLALNSLAIPTVKQEKHHVIIVGAGVSGFTAAATLLEHNITDILVLEATDRIGGRIHTIQFGGVTIDKGAEFCHGQENNSVYELVKPHNLLVSYKPYLKPENFLFANTSGHIFDSVVFDRLIREGMEIVHEDDLEHFNASVADYFYPRFKEFAHDKNLDSVTFEVLEHLLPLIELAESGAEDLSKMGAFGNTDLLVSKGEDLKWAPNSSGYKTIFDILSKKIPNPSEELPVRDKILLSKEVSRVELREENAAVTCTDGSTYLADHVIITVSLGVLKKHAATTFNPPLPPQKTKAIETLGFGCLGKVFLLFTERWWPKNITTIVPLINQQELLELKKSSDVAYWAANVTGFFPVINNDRMLCAWVPGSACIQMDDFSTIEVTNGLMEILNKTVGHKFNITRPESVLKSEWASYPYTRGSYSYRSVESDKYNITNSDLAEPVLQGDKPVLMFAGEATNHDYSSTVHGALDTGRREAFNLIHYLNSHP